jgi:hypothetical protein
VILCFPQKSSISCVSLIPPIPLPPTSRRAAFQGSNFFLLQSITFLRAQTHLALWSSKHPYPVNLWRIRLWQNNVRLWFKRFGLPLMRKSALIDKGLSGIPTTMWSNFGPFTPGSTRWLCLKAQMLSVKEKCKCISRC